LDKIGRIPKEKDQIAVGNFLITVREMEGNRIKEFIVKQDRVPSVPQDTATN
jgi:CBS domain containing-hemolysin-like protein